MCDLATAGFVMSAVGTATSAYGMYQQGQAAEAQGEYQAAVSRNNAIIAERNARLAEERGKVAETQKQRQIQQLIGRQRAGAAASGVEVDTGSALLARQDIAEMGAFDIENIKFDTAMEAYNYRVAGSQAQSQAALYQAQGSQAATAGMIGAGGTLLTGAGQFAGKWYDYKNTPKVGSVK